MQVCPYVSRCDKSHSATVIYVIAGLIGLCLAAERFFRKRKSAAAGSYVMYGRDEVLI